MFVEPLKKRMPTIEPSELELKVTPRVTGLSETSGTTGTVEVEKIDVGQDAAFPAAAVVKVQVCPVVSAPAAPVALIVAV